MKDDSKAQSNGRSVLDVVIEVTDISLASAHFSFMLLLCVRDCEDINTLQSYTNILQPERHKHICLSQLGIFTVSSVHTNESLFLSDLPLLVLILYNLDP